MKTIKAYMRVAILSSGVMLALCVTPSPNFNVEAMQVASKSQVANCLDTDQEITPQKETHLNGAIRLRYPRVQLKLNSSTQLEVTELQPETAIDELNPIISISQGAKNYTYLLRRLLKGGESFRINRVRSLCIGPGEGILVIAFEAGATDFLQGFAFVKFTSDDIVVSGVPIVQQGKVVIERSHPEDFELWSADSRGMSLCAACSKRYVVKQCKLNRTSLQCRRTLKPNSSLLPNDVTSDLIQIH